MLRKKWKKKVPIKTKLTHIFSFIQFTKKKCVICKQITSITTMHYFDALIIIFLINWVLSNSLPTSFYCVYVVLNGIILCRYTTIMLSYHSIIMALDIMTVFVEDL